MQQPLSIVITLLKAPAPNKEKGENRIIRNFVNFAFPNHSFLQVDRLEDELVGEQEKYKAITEELEQTFAEMSGY